MSLPHLWHLDFSNKDFQTVPTEFFERTIFPKLRSLKYSCPYFPPPANIFLPSVESLSLCVSGLFRDDLPHALASMPHLTELEFLEEPQLMSQSGGVPENQEHRNGLLSYLMPDDRSLPLPALHSIHLLEFRQISDSELLSFIRARTGPGCSAAAPLKYVRVKMEREIEWDIMPRLEALISGGLEVSLEYVAPVPYSPWEGLDLED
ncbi:hypothetical protein B0H11DRAFT_1922156 [Mycena galericulata]|nr:hypothetical protein B0H11DRAFT_1922156 [Mycena galericulata]